MNTVIIVVIAVLAALALRIGIQKRKRREASSSPPSPKGESMAGLSTIFERRGRGEVRLGLASCK